MTPTGAWAIPLPLDDESRIVHRFRFLVSGALSMTAACGRTFRQRERVKLDGSAETCRECAEAVMKERGA